MPKTQTRTTIFTSDSLPPESQPQMSTANGSVELDLTRENELISHKVGLSDADTPLVSLQTVTLKVVLAAKRVEVPPTKSKTQARATIFASDSPLPKP